MAQLMSEFLRLSRSTLDRTVDVSCSRLLFSTPLLFVCFVLFCVAPGDALFKGGSNAACAAN